MKEGKSMEKAAEDYAKQYGDYETTSLEGRVKISTSKKAFIAGLQDGSRESVEADEYRSMLIDILLEMEYGQKEIPIEKRVANIFNKHPNVIIGHNPITKAVGIQYLPAPTH